jgi:Tfp pilus assembly protein PilW
MFVIALFSVLLVGIFTILRVGSEQSDLSQTKMTLQESAREALNKMSQEIRQSAPDKVTLPANGLSIQLTIPDPATLVDSGYGVNWAGAHTVQYARGGQGNRQILRTDQTSNQISVIANDVASLQFTGDATPPHVITITVGTQRTLASGRAVPANPLQLTAQAEIRNPCQTPTCT